MRVSWLTPIVGLALLVGPAAAETYYVNGPCGDDAWSGLSPACQAPDGPKRTIQAALDAASGGDTVIVADGVYTGAGNKNLDYDGKAIALCSENGPDTCVIDCEGSGKGFYFHRQETPAAVVDGFTIRNGNSAAGAGVYCLTRCHPTIRHCIITQNVANSGAGLYCYESNPTLINCAIVDNTASSGGGGVYTLLSAPTFINCTIAGNEGDWGGGLHLYYRSDATIRDCLIVGNSATGAGGGGILCRNETAATITGCTIAQNTTAGDGGAIHCTDGSSPSMRNTILWDNAATRGAEIALASSADPSTLTVSYCDVAGGAGGAYVEAGCTLDWGTGNIAADPLFVDPDGPDDDPGTWGDNDHHLAGNSPCVDAGDPGFITLPGETDSDDEARVWDGDGDDVACVDMGCDEFGSFVFGDLNCDGLFNAGDIPAFVLALADAAAYASSHPDCDRKLADINADGLVNAGDIPAFVSLLVGS